jgi:hypothetical protein
LLVTRTKSLLRTSCSISLRMRRITRTCV